MEKEEEDGRNDPREKRLGEEESKEKRGKLSDRRWIESRQEDQDEKSFEEGKEEDEKGLGRETLKVDSAFEEVSQIENERPGKGIKAERISRKEIHEIS
jgi:hypothetical protein